MAINKRDKQIQKRVVVYLDESDYNRLRAALILKGKTVSEWTRIIIKDFLNKQQIV